MRILQKTDKKVFHVVNKIDSEKSEFNSVDFFQLGVEHIYAMSAKNRYGLRDFLDVSIEEMVLTSWTLFKKPCPKWLFQGSPSLEDQTLKSTLINLLVGEERLVANPTPGTTRDSIDR